jgi:hypothetical protein
MSEMQERWAAAKKAGAGRWEQMAFGSHSGTRALVAFFSSNARDERIGTIEQKKTTKK